MNAASLRSDTFHPGTWLGIGSPVIAEMVGELGFAWVLFDMEHGNFTDAAVPDQLRALRGSKTAGIVRVGAPYPDLIARLLDWGADGIMVPHVNTAAEAEACVQAMRYPPRGKRGVSRTTRATGYGLRPPQSPDDVPIPFFMAQIETIEAVAAARDIAKVEGVDVLFVGPADLAFDLKARPELVKMDYDACLREVVSAAQAAGKQTGILLRDAQDVPRHRELGFTHIAMETDVVILRKGLQSLLNFKP